MAATSNIAWLRTDKASRRTAQGWSESREKEAAFTEKKCNTRRAEDLICGTIAGVDAQNGDSKMRDAATRNLRSSINCNIAAHKKRMRCSAGDGVAFDFADARVFLASLTDQEIDERTAVARGAGALMTTTLEDAHMCVVPNVSDLSQSVRWTAALLGQFVCNKQYMYTCGSSGVCIKFKRALVTPRQIFVTPECMRRHDRLYNRIKTLVDTASGRKRWKFLSTERELLDLARKRGKAHDYEAVLWTTAAEAVAPPSKWKCVRLCGTPTYFFGVIKDVFAVRGNFCGV